MHWTSDNTIRLGSKSHVHNLLAFSTARVRALKGECEPSDPKSKT
jgi:hypothetical protein